MSASLANAHDLSSNTSLMLGSALPISERNTAARKPNLFLRILEEIGKSYCVRTPDGEYYILPLH
jgi:hypothetical protein